MLIDAYTGLLPDTSNQFVPEVLVVYFQAYLRLLEYMYLIGQIKP